MSKFTDLLTGGVGESVAKTTDSIMTGLDNLFTSDEQRIKAQAIIYQVVLDAQNASMDIAAKVAIADVQSDSVLAKNIRPVVAGITTVIYVYSVIAGSGAFGLTVTPEIVKMVDTATTMVYAFYFGGRTIEKITSTVSGMFSKKKEGK